MPASRCPMRGPDPFAAAYVADPYPALADLRRDAPVCFIEDLNLWLVTKFEDARAILRDASTFSNAITQKPLFPICDEAKKILDDANFMPEPAPVGLTGSDAPIHTRLRRHLNRALAFTPANLATMEPAVAHAASELIDRFIARGHAEILSELTGVLPARVVFKVIGFQEEDHEVLRTWCADRLTMFWGRASVDEQCKVAHGLASYWNYCVKFAESNQPTTNLTGELIRISVDEPGSLTRIEIAGILFGLIFAGQETTANSLTEMLRMLLQDRRQWELLRENRALLPNAFEEALRMSPPIAAWRRITTKATSLSGVEIPAGAHVLIHLGSASHDEAVFAEGENFDVQRPNSTKHLAFGYGVHFCLGAPLSRMEARVLLNTLLDRVPTMRLAVPQSFEYVANLSFRAPKRLFVEWDAASRHV